MIGIDDYSAGGTKAWNTLRSARRDAMVIGRTLQKNFGFRVTTLLDEHATRSGIFAALEELAVYGSNDAVLIYYAGHGAYDDTLGEGYWVPSDGDREDPSGWIANKTIETFIRACRARHILLVSDSCYSGSLFRGEAASLEEKSFWYQRVLMRPSRYLLTSGNLEPVLAGTRRGHSVFAQEVLNVLDDRSRKVFSLTELSRQIKPRVADLTGQMPRDGAMKMA
ncbi:MAG: caspase family protein, partial [Verrucomicrobiota bacterium]